LYLFRVAGKVSAGQCFSVSSHLRAKRTLVQPHRQAPAWSHLSIASTSNRHGRSFTRRSPNNIFAVRIRTSTKASDSSSYPIMSISPSPPRRRFHSGATAAGTAIGDTSGA
jgi:hypothetical protein